MADFAAKEGRQPREYGKRVGREKDEGGSGEVKWQGVVFSVEQLLSMMLFFPV